MFKQRMILNGYLGTSRVAKRAESWTLSMSNNDNDSAGFTSGEQSIQIAGLPDYVCRIATTKPFD